MLSVWKYACLKSRIYEISSERIKVTTGIVNRKTEELELYRVKDMSLVEPFAERLVGVGTIRLTTNDQTSPTLDIIGIKDAKSVREELRKQVELCRDRKRVRLSELE